MFKRVKTSYYTFGAAMTTGMLVASSGSAHAAAQGSNNFTNIAGNIVGSISGLPNLISTLAYLFGVLLAVLGIMKIKDHVENPSQTPLKDGAIRLAAGGGLFAVPIVMEAMLQTIGEGNNISAATVNNLDNSVFSATP